MIQTFVILYSIFFIQRTRSFLDPKPIASLFLCDPEPHSNNDEANPAPQNLDNDFSNINQDENLLYAEFTCNRFLSILMQSRSKSPTP